MRSCNLYQSKHRTAKKSIHKKNGKNTAKFQMAYSAVKIFTHMVAEFSRAYAKR
nr:MAG TPA_asm: hypothetical protein [Caudoviricetes sp.]